MARSVPVPVTVISNVSVSFPALTLYSYSHIQVLFERTRKVTNLGQCLPQVGFPVIKLLEKTVTRRVAFSSVDQSFCSTFDQDTIDELGDTLISRHPVGIPTPKQSKLDTLHLASVHALDPFDEAAGVVRRLAFKRRSDNYDRLVRWEVADRIIEG